MISEVSSDTDDYFAIKGINYLNILKYKTIQL